MGVPKDNELPAQTESGNRKTLFLINDEAYIHKVVERNAIYNEEHYLLGNYFYTEEEATAKRDEILTRQKAYDEEMMKNQYKIEVGDTVQIINCDIEPRIPCIELLEIGKVTKVLEKGTLIVETTERSKNIGGWAANPDAVKLIKKEGK